MLVLCRVIFADVIVNILHIRNSPNNDREIITRKSIQNVSYAKLSYNNVRLGSNDVFKTCNIYMRLFGWWKTLAARPYKRFSKGKYLFQ